MRGAAVQHLAAQIDEFAAGGGAADRRVPFCAGLLSFVSNEGAAPHAGYARLGRLL
jgi:hypothetical protein